VFGGRREQMQIQPLTTSTGAIVLFLNRIQAQTAANGRKTRWARSDLPSTTWDGARTPSR
jgi:hypothetical protein